MIADEDSEPAFVAADLLSQAEHGADSQVVLVGVSLSDAKLAQIEAEVDKQAHALSRIDIVWQSVSRSLIVKTRSPEEALQFSNEYAPEHLIIYLRNAPALVSHVRNAGSVFVGPYTPVRCVLSMVIIVSVLIVCLVAVETTRRERTTLSLQMGMRNSLAVSTPNHSKSTSLPKKSPRRGSKHWVPLLPHWQTAKASRLMQPPSGYGWSLKCGINTPMSYLHALNPFVCAIWSEHCISFDEPRASQRREV